MKWIILVALMVAGVVLADPGGTGPELEPCPEGTARIMVGSNECVVGVPSIIDLQDSTDSKLNLFSFGIFEHTEENKGWRHKETTALEMTYRVRCGRCVKEKKKSSVHSGMCFTTLMACPRGYWDEDGKWVPPIDCNTTTCQNWCSNGHWWTD